jgi:hypothetical protein
MLTAFHYTGLHLLPTILKEGLQPYDIEFGRGAAPKTIVADEMRQMKGDALGVWLWPEVWDWLLEEFFLFHRCTGRSKEGVLLKCQYPQEDSLTWRKNEQGKVEGNTWVYYHTLDFTFNDEKGKPAVNAMHRVPADIALAPIPPKRLKVLKTVQISIRKPRRF